MKIVLLKGLIFYFFIITNTFGETQKQNCRSYVEWDNNRHCLLEINREYVVPIDTELNNSQPQPDDFELGSEETILMQSDRDAPPDGLITEDISEE